jgi:hypothetical protein
VFCPGWKLLPVFYLKVGENEEITVSIGERYSKERIRVAS